MNRITQYLPDDELFSVDDLDEALFAFDGRDLDPGVGLQNNFIRHFDPTPGQWLDENPLGDESGDDNLHPYVGQ